MKKNKPKEIDIYNIPRRLKDARRRISEDTDVSKRNQELIFGFDDYLKRKQSSGPYSKTGRTNRTDPKLGCNKRVYET